MSNELWSGFMHRASYDIELISDLLVTTAAGVAYGYIEAFWIPTSIWAPSALRIFGRFAYYHIGFFALMLALTIGLVITHYQWFDPTYHTAHIIYALATFSGLLPLAFMVEDMSWFALQLRPIQQTDWTVVWGLGFNVGKITYVPGWYIFVIVWTWLCLSVALTFARKSYEKRYGKPKEASQADYLAQPRSYSAMTEILGEISGPLVIVADTHLGLIAGKRIYGISNNSASDTLGFAGFIQWLQHLELNTVQVARGSWGKEPLQIRKPNSLILLGDYLELWDSTDDAVDISSRGIWNELEKLSCKKLYVIGNHDYEISEVKGTYPQGMGSIQVLPSTCPPEESKESETKNQEHESWLKIGGVSYLFLHGHQFDASFRHFGKAWTFVSYLRDGAEAFRLWSWVLTAIGLGMTFVAFVLSNSIAWSVALTLLITVGAPRLIITVARPIYAKFGTRYQVEKALNNIASWWKDYAKKNNVPSGNLRVVYGHTHLIDVYDSSDFGQKLPDQLTLVNLPSWVMDVREEYSKILRDVALYVDDDGFHFLGWDWEKLEPFYIPTDVAKVIAGGNAIDGRIAEELKAIGWPDKLLSKLVQPPQIPSLKHPASEARRALYNRLQSVP